MAKNQTQEKMQMRYKTPAALEMAVKAAAKASPLDTNRAISGFYFDRLLCRIFSESEPTFILKGGQGMIARTLSARTTRDIDLISTAVNIEEALENLKRLASVDFDDFLTYVFARTEEIKAEEEYREGYKVFFTPYFGTGAKNEISVDLVVDQVICEKPEKLTPKGRLEIEGLETFDYLLYPVINGMADKICATMRLYDGQESSRIKDFVDLVVYLTTENFEAEALKRQVTSEAALRKMAPIERLVIPESWLMTINRGRYTKLASETRLSNEFHNIDNAYALVSNCIDEALTGKANGRIWSFQTLKWESRGQDEWLQDLSAREDLMANIAHVL